MNEPVGKQWDVIRYIDELERVFGYLIPYTSGYVCRGWMQLIWNMLQEIDVTTNVEDGHPEFVDIKEKYGTLRVYGGNITDEVQNIIDRYSDLSAKTCMTCGQPGKMRDKSEWYYVSCDQHERK
jgi:hypothetical protein